MEKKKNSPLLSLLISIVIPAIILSKFSNEQYLGVLPGFIIALAFPIGQSIYEMVSEHKVSAISVIGLISTFLTGIIGVLQLPSEWMKYKEAAVPLIIGAAIVISHYTSYPLIRKLFVNDTLFDMERINGILTEKSLQQRFDKVIAIATYMIGASFIVSSVLNFTLTKIIIQSPSGTPEFNEELGRLTALSYPVIALPSTLIMMLALWYLIKQIKNMTGLTFEEMLSETLREQSAEKK